MTEAPDASGLRRRSPRSVSFAIEGRSVAVATGSFRAVPDDLAEWYVPYLDGLALGIVTAGQSGQTAATATRAVRRLKKELLGAPLID